MLLEIPGEKHLRSILAEPRRLNCWSGAVRSAKTTDANLAWIIDIAQRDPGPSMMVGRSISALERNVLTPIEELLDPAAFHHTQGSNEARIFGQRCWLVGANNVAAEHRIRGATLLRAYGDEVTTWPENVFKQLTARLSLPGARGYFTTNPDNPNHWYKTDYLDRADELDLARYDFALEDNETLDPEYVRSLKAEYVPGSLWYRRFIDGLWVAAEGAVYDMFNRPDHVVAEHPKVTRWWIAVDHGTTNPFCALLFGMTPLGDIHVASEYWYSSKDHNGRQKTNPQYSKALQGWLTHIVPGVLAASRPYVANIIYDPAAADFGAQLRDDGWVGVTTGSNEVLEGIRDVAAGLAARRVTVHASCTNLIGELEGYSWDRKAGDRGEDKPAKVNDHAVDAFRYGIHTVPGAPSRFTSYA